MKHTAKILEQGDIRFIIYDETETVEIYKEYIFVGAITKTELKELMGEIE